MMRAACPLGGALHPALHACAWLTLHTGLLSLLACLVSVLRCWECASCVTALCGGLPQQALCSCCRVVEGFVEDFC